MSASLRWPFKVLCNQACVYCLIIVASFLQAGFLGRSFLPFSSTPCCYIIRLRVSPLVFVIALRAAVYAKKIICVEE